MGVELTDLDRGIVCGLLLSHASFGGDGRQPQITLRMHVRHEKLFRWLEARVPGGKLYGPGTIAYMPDPHFEHQMHTATGGTIFFVQYPGPSTGAPPIYDGRMNLKEAPPLAQQDLDR